MKPQPTQGSPDIASSRRGPHLFRDGVDSAPTLTLTPEQRRNPAVMLEAIRRDRASFALADPALRADIDFVVEAVSQNPWAVMKVDAALLANPAVALRLVQKSGEVLRYLPDVMRADRRVVTAAIRTSPGAIRFVAEELRYDKNLALMAVKLDGYTVTYLPPGLRVDPEIGMAAVKRSPWCLKYLSNVQQADRDIVYEATVRNFDSIDYAAPELLQDFDLIHALASRNPLLVGALRKMENRVPTCIEEVLTKFPQIEAAYDRLQARVDAAGISTPGRLGSLEVLEEILRNRENPDRVDDRPLAILVFPTHDWNRAFHKEEFKLLTENFRVLYYEANTEDEFIAATRQASQAQKASLLTIGGHGTQDRLALGGKDPARAPVSDKEQYMLDFSDRDQLIEAGVSNAVARNGHIIIKSCSAGVGRDFERNVANMMANIFPQANVWAPTMPSNNSIRLDGNGRFVDPGYLAGEAFTYRIRPAAVPDAAVPRS